LYDASVYGVDQRLDRILSALKEKGMLENTWIFITADHGDELGDHNFYYYHGASIYDSVLWIPLIVLGPGLEPGRRVKNLVQNVDIAPTIQAIAGIEPLSQIGGLSLLEVLRGEKEKIERDFVVGEWQDMIYSYSDGQYKYIYNPLEVCPVKPPFIKVDGCFKYEKEELYHVETDPWETRNILEGNEEVGRDLQKKLGKWIGQEGHERQMRRTMADPGVLEALKRLGYTDGGVKRKGSNR
jgi:arylsulfatase A-like enzyme